ncbi:MAG: AMP-binding protein [Anaerolineales bacterium]|nr:AMP-binding protein [Anaerolineales bacterium]
MNLFEKFERNALNHPGKPAFLCFNKNNWKTFTYGDILDQAQRFFSGLQALRSNSGQACSLTPGMTAAVMTPPSLEFFPFALALLKFGIVPVILDPAIGLKNVGKILNESKPDIYVGNTLTHTLRVLFGWGRNSVKHNLIIENVKGQTSKVKPLLPNSSSLSTYHSPLPTSQSPAAIIYTSGSTGLPKGAIYTQANLAAQLDLLRNTFGITPDEIDLPAFPLYALIDLLLGVTSVIPDITFPVPGKTDPEKVIQAIQKFNVTNMFASPVVLDLLSSYYYEARWLSSPAALRGAYRNHQLQTAPKLPSLKRIITAGAPATIPVQEKFRNLLDEKTELFGIYGATESLPIAKVESREIFTLKEKTEHGAGICLGKPIEGVTVRIIPITDEPILEWQDSLPVESNVVGEITVQSGATTRGYIHREAADRISKIYRQCEEGALPDEAISGLEHKIASLKKTPGQAGKEQERPLNDKVEVIHRMGDAGYFDEEGRLWYCGRKSHRVITKDDVMFTEQIENIFNAHPLVFRTALVSVDGEPVLWVELQKGVKTGKEKVIAELKTLAASHPQAARIQSFLFLKKFPTDVRHNSKIIREKLTELATVR